MVCTEFICLHSSVSPEILEFISTIQKLIRGSPALRQIKFIEFARHVQCHCDLQWMKLHRGSWCDKPRLGVGASQSTTVCCLEGRSGLWVLGQDCGETHSARALGRIGCQLQGLSQSAEAER